MHMLTNFMPEAPMLQIIKQLLLYSFNFDIVGVAQINSVN